jgi:hypothetical protein
MVFQRVVVNEIAHTCNTKRRYLFALAGCCMTGKGNKLLHRKILVIGVCKKRA